MDLDSWINDYYKKYKIKPTEEKIELTKNKYEKVLKRIRSRKIPILFSCPTCGSDYEYFDGEILYYCMLYLSTDIDLCIFEINYVNCDNCQKFQFNKENIKEGVFL